MWKVVFLFSFLSALIINAQTNSFPLKNQDFTKILSNETLGFEGKLAQDSIDVRFQNINRDSKNPEIYYFKGIYELHKKKLTCSGKLTFNYVFNVKGSTDEFLIFGEFQINGTQPDIDDGFMKGKFRIQTRKDPEKRGRFSSTTFKGIYTNLESGEESDVWFSNFSHDDISSVIFK